MPGPDDCPLVPDYSAFEGAEMWVGEELLTGGGTPTGVFGLQATPRFRDWTTVPGGVVRVSDCNIVPCATYSVESVTDVEYSDGTYSPPLVLDTTEVWGDITGAGNQDPADGNLSVLDVAATVDCVKEMPNAPPMTWCDIFLHTPSPGESVGMSVLDVATVVDALKDIDYPFPGPTAPDPCDGAD